MTCSINTSLVGDPVPNLRLGNTRPPDGSMSFHYSGAQLDVKRERLGADGGRHLARCRPRGGGGWPPCRWPSFRVMTFSARSLRRARSGHALVRLRRWRRACLRQRRVVGRLRAAATPADLQSLRLTLRLPRTVPEMMMRSASMNVLFRNEMCFDVVTVLTEMRSFWRSPRRIPAGWWRAPSASRGHGCVEFTDAPSKMTELGRLNFPSSSFSNQVSASARADDLDLRQRHGGLADDVRIVPDRAPASGPENRGRARTARSRPAS